MPDQSTGVRCRTCTRECPVSDFYKSETECIECKKDRSRRNRMLSARKLVLAERLLDLLTVLASQGWRPPSPTDGETRMEATQ